MNAGILEGSSCYLFWAVPIKKKMYSQDIYKDCSLFGCRMTPTGTLE